MSERPSFYPERPQVRIPEVAKNYASAEVSPLPEDVKERVLGFERDLTLSEDLGLENGEHVKGLEKVWSMPTSLSIDFYPEYFLTDDGKKELRDTFSVELPENATIEDVSKALLAVDYQKTSANVVQGVFGRSRRFAENRFMDAFARNNYESLDAVENIPVATVIRKPLALVDKLIAYYKYKEYLKEQEVKLAGDASDEAVARLRMITMHRERVNTLIAPFHATVADLYDQHAQNPTEATTGAVEKLTSFRPFFERLASSPTELQQRYFSRLDKFSSGKGAATPSGDYSPLEQNAMALADTLSTTEKKPRASEYYFKDVDPEALQRVHVSTEQMKQWCEQVLREYGLLSSNTEFSFDRQDRAADGKWQVIVDPKATALSVNSKKGIMTVPGNYQQPIEEAVPVVQHEVTHVLQHENKTRVGLAITEKVGMDRASIFFEGGGMAWQFDAQRELFGNESFSAHPHYLRAIQKRLEGGSYKECVKAFFDSFVALSPEKDKRAILQEAVDRVARIFRHGGKFEDTHGYVTDSEPLVYLEQILVGQSLAEAHADELLLIGGLNIEHATELKRLGLLDTSNVFVPAKKPIDIILPEVERLIRGGSEPQKQTT